MKQGIEKKNDCACVLLELFGFIGKVQQNPLLVSQLELFIILKGFVPNLKE